MVTIFFDDLFEKVDEATFKSKHNICINDKVYNLGDFIFADIEIDGVRIAELYDTMINVKAGTLPLQIRGIHKE